MPFVKAIKDRAYFKRYQVKYRRRRQGKTDYSQRRALIIQDKNKYNSPKYRLVVRFSNKDITAQVIYSKIVGDVVVACAYAHELPRYGVKVGLTNYAAAYCVGLLLARRLLQKVGLADTYTGTEEVNGEYFSVEPDFDGPAPFQAFLDVGLKRTTTGARLFGVLKGAADGGLEVPHSEKRFPGYDPESKEYDAEFHKKLIFGGHVSDYMNMLKEEEPEKYQKVFSQYIKNGIEGDSLEGIYTKAHEAIRADPSFKSSGKAAAQYKRYNATKKSLQQRKNTVTQKKAAFARRMAAAMADE
eukprot:Clim_evm2s218 gene=Clim_evmTU2s218